MKNGKHQKFEHIPVHPETKSQLNEIGRELAKQQNKKNVSYDEIVKHLIGKQKEVKK